MGPLSNIFVDCGISLRVCSLRTILAYPDGVVRFAPVESGQGVLFRPGAPDLCAHRCYRPPRVRE